MPRRPRIKLAEIPQHLVQRCVNREPCFLAEEDYHCYLHWLQKAAADWRCVIHAYVLMTNHVHLLLTPETPAPSSCNRSGGATSNTSTAATNAAAPYGKAASNPVPYKPKPTCSPACATSNSTRYGPTW